ncbi:MAG: MFS transporter [Alphaproteobacteria bacterium]|nr:MFS transporter [Alphaproteobacteria bacterium]
MRLFYGWVIVGAGVVITCIGLGTIFALSVFLQPISGAMGWSRTGISTAALLNFLAMGAGSFLWGALSDRFGTRAVVLCGGLLLGVGLMAASQTGSLVQFQIAFGAVAGLAAGSFYAPLTATATRWFTRHRSLAVALVTAGTGIGSMTVAPLARWLITSYEWRTAMLVIGVLAWVVILPVAFLLRDPPIGSSAGGKTQAGGDDRGFTVAQALRTPQFAAIALTFFACCAAHSGPIFHMVSYAIDCGVGAMTATVVFGTAGLAALCGRVVFGLVGDRFGAKRTMLIGLTIQAVAIYLYVLVRAPASFYALSLVFGLAYGGVMPLYAILVREYFGARIMGTVFGAVAMASTLGMAIGPWAGGWLFDRFGSYSWLYVASFAVGLGAVAVASTFRAPRSLLAAPPAPSVA